jgi:biotin carboxyl carrier protein
VDVRAEMVGKVWALSVVVGDRVAAGSELLALESMKMEIPVMAPVAGVIEAIHVAVDDVVNPGDLLLSILLA